MPAQSLFRRFGGPGTGEVNEVIAAQPLVLLVRSEGRPGASAGVETACAESGFAVVEAQPGAVRAGIEAEPVDIVVLDVGRWSSPAVDLCREVCQHSHVPVVVAAADDLEPDVVLALELGADDYVVTPLRQHEFGARLRAVLRRSTLHRSEGLRAGWHPDDVVQVDGLVLDTAGYRAELQGRHLDLSRREFDVLAVLARNAGRVVHRSTLLERVWGSEYRGSGRTLDTHVSRVRQHIEPDPRVPRHIKTVRFVGYRMSTTLR